MSIRITLAAATALLALSAAAASHAGAMTGALWLNSPEASAVTASVPSGPPDATFVPGALNYDSSLTGYTIGAFLNNPVFLTGGGVAGDNLDNTFFQFTGTIGLLSGNNSFVVGHDDGIYLSIPGIGYTLADGGPTAFTNTPFTVVNPGPAGNFAFTLNYGECCGPPADLLFSINSVVVHGGVPEPATWSLMLLGLGGLGGVLRRKARLAVAA